MLTRLGMIKMQVCAFGIIFKTFIQAFFPVCSVQCFTSPWLNLSGEPVRFMSFFLFLHFSPSKCLFVSVCLSLLSLLHSFLCISALLQIEGKSDEALAAFNEAEPDMVATHGMQHPSVIELFYNKKITAMQKKMPAKQRKAMRDQAALKRAEVQQFYQEYSKSLAQGGQKNEKSNCCQKKACCS